MTGLRPDTLQLWTFVGNFRQSHPDWVPLPQHFKDRGYAPVLGGGKTYHPNRPPHWDEPLSWTQEKEYFGFYEPGCPTNHTLEPGSNAYTHSVCPLEGPLSQFFDHNLANFSIQALRLAKSQQSAARAEMAAAAAPTNLVRPFFLAAGFRRPHLPWQLPKAFWDKFSDETLADAAHPAVPQGLPPVAFTCGDKCSWELNSSDHTMYNFSIDRPVATPLART